MKGRLKRNIGCIYRVVILFVISAILMACHNYPKEVEYALEMSGKNQSEIKKVLEHYSGNRADSLKLKAAYFLIGNMPEKYYYDGALLKEFYKCVERAEDKHVLDSLVAVYGEFNINRLHKKSDLNYIKASFLINNIEMAFKVWREQPWDKDVSFSQFCEYILPYRIGDEIPDYDRSQIYEQYDHVLDSVRATGGDALKACFAINNQLKKEGWNFYSEVSFMPHFSAKKLVRQKNGDCRDMVDKAMFIMRALGIPVASDFTPNWANRSGGHEWNVVLDKNGKNHVFMGTENNDSRENGLNHRYKFPKVFRKTFAHQQNYSDSIDGDKSKLPFVITNPFVKDVTAEDLNSMDVTIDLSNPSAHNYKYTYICIFNNSKWIPIYWGTKLGDKVIFKKMMKNIVYLIVYDKDGELIPANAPFLLTNNGKINYLNADKPLESVTLYRKFPIFIKSDYCRRMTGGKFQASNKSDFSDARTLYTITNQEVEMKWYDISYNPGSPYKYYRYLSPNGGWGNIAELELYADKKKIEGNVIGAEGSYNNKAELTYKSAMDGNNATYFDYNKPNGGWVGLDCGKPIKINKIRFLPRNDDNGIDVGQKYELNYWKDNQWFSAGLKIAKENQLLYKNVPSNALFLLRNLTKGTEERIFTYKNGKQVWW